MTTNMPRPTCRFVACGWVITRMDFQPMSRRTARNEPSAVATYVSAMVTVLALFGFGGALTSPQEPSEAEAPTTTERSGTSIRTTTTVRSPSTTTEAPTFVEVPSLDLLSESEARRVLRESGLNWRFQREEVGSVDFAFVIGHVYEQTPEPGELVKVGHQVALTSGKRPVARTQQRAEPLPEGEWIDVSGVDAVGQCGNIVSDPPGWLVQPVACERGHDLELASKFTIDAPGVLDFDAIADQMDLDCDEALDEYTGLAQSSLSFYWVWPGEEAWAAGERIGYCYVTAQGQLGSLQLVGSAANSMW